MNVRTIALPCLAALGLAGCVQPAAPSVGSRNPVYSTDLAGKAANCTAGEVALNKGPANAATIATGGGGWCGLAVTSNGNAVTAGLLTQRPQHGKVYIHTVGDVTRVDYTPATTTVAADTFTVKFLPGDETMRVTVTGASMAAAK